jgi:hypothetical protein
MLQSFSACKRTFKMSETGSLAERQVSGNEPRKAAILGPSWAVSAADPDPVTPDSGVEYLIAPEAAPPFSGSRFDTKHFAAAVERRA